MFVSITALVKRFHRHPQILTLNRSLSFVWNSTSKTIGEMSFPKRDKAWRLFSVTLRQKHALLPTTTACCLRAPWCGQGGQLSYSTSAV